MSKADKIMVAGDWHGNTTWAGNMVKVAGEYGIKMIIQCGDFGIWTHEEEGHNYLDTVNERARKYGVKVYFIGGNHENWDHLNWWEKNNARTFLGHVIVRSHIRYIPRGLRWEWNNRTFLGVGGAVSIDVDMRLREEKKPRTLWWPEEVVTQSDIAKIEAEDKRIARKLDYLITHDCPTNAPFKFRLKDDPESHMHRQLMDRLGRTLKPNLWFHGHMHDKYDAYPFPTYNSHSTVYGLECDGMQSNWGVLDTNTSTFIWNSQFVQAGNH